MVALCISRTAVLISFYKMLILVAEDTNTRTEAINAVHLTHLLKTDGFFPYSIGEEGGEGTIKKALDINWDGCWGIKGKKPKPTCTE